MSYIIVALLIAYFFTAINAFIFLGGVAGAVALRYVYDRFTEGD